MVGLNTWLFPGIDKSVSKKPSCLPANLCLVAKVTPSNSGIDYVSNGHTALRTCKGCNH
ncbi:hypothetical protein BaRGS_00018957, partial [Batillaria attramentaria]